MYWSSVVSPVCLTSNFYFYVYLGGGRVVDGFQVLDWVLSIMSIGISLLVYAYVWNGLHNACWGVSVGIVFD